MNFVNKECRICWEIKPASEFNKDKKAKDGLDGRCHECYIAYRKKNYLKTKSLRKEYSKKRKFDFPWERFYYGIVDRCENKKSKIYPKYGAKGIKCLLTMEDVKFIWFRDLAWMLERPSVDRWNNKKNYTRDNCHFMEITEHGRKTRCEQLGKPYACKQAWELSRGGKGL